MTRTVQVAVLQYCAGPDQVTTLPLMRRLITEAADSGAVFICLPECANFLAKDRAALQELAKTFQIHINAGSLMMRANNDDCQANRGYLIGPDGAILTRYNKIHMFDADVGDGKQYRESENFKPGDAVVHYKTAIGHIGLSICYDIRFPNLYRQLGQAGTEIITIPAAFTQTTGAAHWHVLQRARAIETGSFILAAAQCGRHADGRQTYGHSLIINPWGKILADAGDRANSFVKAEIDLDEVKQARAALRHLQHRPNYS